MQENLDVKSVEELKEMAKKVKIKGYYKMRKKELIEALTEEQVQQIDESFREEVLSEIDQNPKIFELRKIAKRLGISFQRSIKKEELKDRIVRFLSRKGVEIMHYPLSSAPEQTKIQPVLSSSMVDLPFTYNKDVLQGFAVNPRWISFYWDFSKQTIQLKEKLEIEKKFLVLRVYDITFIQFNGKNAHQQWDYLLQGNSNRKYYVQVPMPRASYIAEIGYYNVQNEFIPLLRSTVIQTPPCSLSNKLEERWIDLSKDYRFTQIHEGILSEPTFTPKGFSSLNSEELKGSLSSVIFRKPADSEEKN